MGKATLRFRPSQDGLTATAGVKFVSAILAHSAIDRSIQGHGNANPNTQERNTMSPNVGNFVHDLVEMAKAMETLPQVQADLDRANTTVENYAKQVQDREIAIIGYKEQIETLQSKVRATEAERDDAELRFLELDEKAHKASNSLYAALAMVEGSITDLNPPKPQPEPVREPEPFPSSAQPVQSAESAGIQPSADQSMAASTQPYTDQGSSEVPPTNPATEQATSVSSNNATTSDAGKTAEGSASQGQGEVNPTMTSHDAGGQASEGSQSATTAQDGSTATAEPKPSGPYTGKLYYDCPIYIAFSDWINGGGTEADYHWRPSVGSVGSLA